MNRLNTLSAPDRVRIQVILGSTREGQFGDRVANWFYGLAAKCEDLIAELIDLLDWPLPFFNEPKSPITGHYAPQARAWAAKMAQGDGYVFVTPEYNFAYPAVLKRLV
jgi:NAD(P)H-dependent FMN reductase